MQTSIETENKGWASITDVGCPFCKVGLLRHAEAGYVPGWRQCDACTAQYLGDPATGRLVNKRRGKRVTAQRIAAVERARQEAREHQERIDVALGTAAGTRDLAGSYLGADWHHYSGNIGDLGVTWLRAYSTAWRAGATPEALAALDSVAPLMPSCVQISAISRDGKQVNLYHRRRANGLFGGTSIVSLEGLLRALTSYPEARNSDELVARANAD